MVGSWYPKHITDVTLLAAEPQMASGDSMGGSAPAQPLSPVFVADFVPGAKIPSTELRDVSLAQQWLRPR